MKWITTKFLFSLWKALMLGDKQIREYFLSNPILHSLIDDVKQYTIQRKEQYRAEYKARYGKEL
jgi:hypothetical protein